MVLTSGIVILRSKNVIIYIYRLHYKVDNKQLTVILHADDGFIYNTAKQQHAPHFWLTHTQQNGQRHYQAGFVYNVNKPQ